MHLAQRAAELTEYQRPGVLDTLAAAYAAEGDFDKALETANKAIEIAKATKNYELAARIKSRLQLYQMDQPYLDTP